MWRLEVCRQQCTSRRVLRNSSRQRLRPWTQMTTQTHTKMNFCFRSIELYSRGVMVPHVVCFCRAAMRRTNEATWASITESSLQRNQRRQIRRMRHQSFQTCSGLHTILMHCIFLITECIYSNTFTINLLFIGKTPSESHDGK